MPRRHPFHISTAIILLLLAVPCSGEEPAERPRIGLCLAGGGARGGAHIGVLKVLEELHVPVDFIAGTSIGSIIGGLYASGMSTSEMDSTLAGLDWFDLFDESSPRGLISIRRKEEDRLPLFGLNMGFNETGFKMPTGMVGGQKLMFLLRRLTLPTMDVDDFDDLPIPFRAVASSLNDGSMVVLDRGSLADAMRASMAIPGAFTPHVIDGQSLVDGGLLRNMPVDVVKAMGADIIIAVDVGKPVSEFNQDPTVMGILIQTVDLTIGANTLESRSQIREQDVLLTPDLEGIGVESFELMGEASDRGLAIALENADLLRNLALPASEYEAWRTGVQDRRGDGTVRVDSIRIDSPGRVDPRRVRMQVRSQPKAMLDQEVLAGDLARVYRLGEFENVDFSFEEGKEPNSKDLVIRTQDKSWGPNYLRIGLSLEGNFEGEARSILFLYHRLASINRLGAEWRNILSLGDLLGLETEFYQPLTMNGRFFVAPRLSGTIDKRQRWLEPDQSEIVTAKQGAGQLDFGLNISHWGELRLGAYAGEFNGSGEDDSLDMKESLGGWQARLVLDNLDDYDFPRRGMRVSLEGRLSRDQLGATTEYDRLSARIQGAATGGRTTFFGKIEGGTSFGSPLPFNDRFELGGFSRLSGLEAGRIFGDDAAYMNAGLFVRIWKLHPAIGGNVFAGLAGEAGQAWSYAENPSLEDLILGTTAFLGFETLAGPVYLGYGWADGGHNSFYILLGRTF